MTYRNVSFGQEGSFIWEVNRVPLPNMNEKAPDFKVPAITNKTVHEIQLSDYQGKFLLLLFYPLDFTFVCPTEIISFNNKKGEFEKMNTEVVAVSTDSIESHLAWVNTDRKEGGLGEVQITLASDKSKKMSQSYGVLDDNAGVAYRGLFIIDGSQNLRQIIINDLPVGRNVDEALRLVQAIQYADEHGEVCPANWKPGLQSIKPDRDSSLKYFQEANS